MGEGRKRGKGGGGRGKGRKRKGEGGYSRVITMERGNDLEGTGGVFFQ